MTAVVAPLPFTTPPVDNPPVFPLHGVLPNGRCTCPDPNCPKPGKHPRWHKDDLPHGHNSASAEHDQIETWRQRWPDCNWAMPTGAVSRTIVIDVDPRHGGDVSLSQLQAQHGQLPDTYKVRTPSDGWHLYFQHPGTPIACDTQGKVLGVGIDVKADGGYVALPGSFGAGGNTYVEAPESTGALTPLPRWLYLLLTATTPKASRPRGGTPVVEQTIPEGQRHGALLTIAGAMRRHGASVGSIEAALLADNGVRCTPPLPEHEVRQIARSADWEPEPNHCPDYAKLALPITDLQAELERLRDRNGVLEARLKEAIQTRDELDRELRARDRMDRNPYLEKGFLTTMRALCATLHGGAEQVWLGHPQVTAAKKPRGTDQRKGEEDDGARSYPKGSLAWVTGQSPSTVRRHIEKAKTWRLLDAREVDDGVNIPLPNGKRRRLPITRLEVELAMAPDQLYRLLDRFNPAEVDPAHKPHGGPRLGYCPDHPHADVILRESYHCRKCGRVVAEPTEQPLTPLERDQLAASCRTVPVPTEQDAQVRKDGIPEQDAQWKLFATPSDPAPVAVSKRHWWPNGLHIVEADGGIAPPELPHIPISGDPLPDSCPMCQSKDYRLSGDRWACTRCGHPLSTSRGQECPSTEQDAQQPVPAGAIDWVNPEANFAGGLS